MPHAEARRRGERKQQKKGKREMNSQYGSELHLLRWLGRHRDDLTLKVENATGLSNVRWKQFKFSSGSKAFDVEIKKLEFLTRKERESVGTKYEKHLNPNWDAVAEGILDGKKTYVLVEAKAHIEEVGDNSEHGGSRKEEISQALELAANDITGIAGIGEEWMGRYYQMANRLYVQWVLNKSDISAIQLSLFFCGDVNNGYICPKTRAEWQDELLKEKKELRLTTPKAKEFLAQHYRELYIDVRSNRDII